MWKALSILAAGEAGSAIKRNLTVLAIYAAAGVVALIGAVFGLVLLQDWLSLRMPALQAGLIVTGGLFGFALVLALVAVVAGRRRRSSPSLATAALVAAPVAAKMVGGRLNLATIAVLSAGVLGVIFARSLGKDE